MSFNKTIQIGSKTIGPDHPTYFIAEIGGNFDGSKEKAKRLIDAAKDAGADCANSNASSTPGRSNSPAAKPRRPPRSNRPAPGVPVIPLPMTMIISFIAP